MFIFFLKFFDKKTKILTRLFSCRVLLTFGNYYNIIHICVNINPEIYTMMQMKLIIFTTEYVFRGNPYSYFDFVGVVVFLGK